MMIFAKRNAVDVYWSEQNRDGIPQFRNISSLLRGCDETAEMGEMIITTTRSGCRRSILVNCPMKRQKDGFLQSTRRAKHCSAASSLGSELRGYNDEKHFSFRDERPMVLLPTARAPRPPPQPTLLHSPTTTTAICAVYVRKNLTSHAKLNTMYSRLERRNEEEDLALVNTNWLDD